MRIIKGTNNKKDLQKKMRDQISFGTYLKDYLEYNNISQSEFAIRMGITQKHMNEIINGKANITLEMAANIERLTGISSSFIISVENSRKMKEKIRFHELGHCKSDYNDAKSKVIIDGNEEKEKRADKFAINCMINDSVWKEIIENYSSRAKLEEISRKYEIPMSFIVGRLAKNKYIKYSEPLYTQNYQK